MQLLSRLGNLGLQHLARLGILRFQNAARVGILRLQLLSRLGNLGLQHLARLGILRFQDTARVDYQRLEPGDIGFGGHMRLFGFTGAFDARDSLLDLPDAFNHAGMRYLLQGFDALR